MRKLVSAGKTIDGIRSCVVGEEISVEEWRLNLGSSNSLVWNSLPTTGTGVEDPMPQKPAGLLWSLTLPLACYSVQNVSFPALGLWLLKSEDA